MSTLAEYISAVRETVREANASLSYSMRDEEYTTFVRRSLRRYSIDRPQIKNVSITGTDSKYITINNTNFPDYVDQFSTILTVEADSPTIADNEKPNYIERDEWDTYRSTSTLYLYLKNHQPDTDETMKITYTVPHTINELDSETTDSVPVIDFEAIVYYAANEALLALAGKYAGHSDPTMRSDVVNYRTKSAEFRALAKEYRDLYREWISQPIKAASVIRDLDFGLSFADGMPFLTHRSKSRS